MGSFRPGVIDVLRIALVNLDRPDRTVVADADQNIETVDPLRTDKDLHTKIGKSTDGHGNPLSNEQ